MRLSVWAAVFLAIVTPITALATPLRVSVPPLFGSVPVILASRDGWGLFAEEGLDVTLIPLSSQSDRMQAFQARQVDVLITDLTQALMILSQRDADAVIAGTTYSTEALEEDSPRPVSLVTPQRFANISTLEELALQNRRLRISVPGQSDLEFMLDQLFMSCELTPPRRAYALEDDLLKNAQLLGVGAYQAGVFPQPYADYLMAIDLDSNPDFTVLSNFAGITVPPTVVLFRRSILEHRTAEVAAFFRALERAVVEVNQLPREELQDLGWQLATQLFLPGQEPEALSPEDRQIIEQAIEALFIPDFPKPAPLEKGVFYEVLSWAEGRGYVRSRLDFDEVVVPPVR